MVASSICSTWLRELYTQFGVMQHNNFSHTKPRKTYFCIQDKVNWGTYKKSRNKVVYTAFPSTVRNKTYNLRDWHISNRKKKITKACYTVSKNVVYPGFPDFHKVFSFFFLISLYSYGSQINYKNKDYQNNVKS